MIPAIVRDTGDDTLLRDALLENIHRVQLNPWRKPPPTSNCSTSSGSPTTNWPRGSGGPAR